MDTRSRKFKTQKAAYVILFIFEVILICALGVGVSIFIAVSQMEWLRLTDQEMAALQNGDILPEDLSSYYSGVVTDQGRFEFLQNLTGIGCIAGGIAAIGILILLGILVGRGSRLINEDGSIGEIKLNWFDKVWSEVVIAVCIGAGFAFAAVMNSLYDEWIQGHYLGIWECLGEGSEVSSILTRQVTMTVYVVVLICSCILALQCLMSLIKKIKAGRFWEKSLIGKIFYGIIRAIRESNETMLKILGCLIAGAFLSATWVGLPVILVLILIFVPKTVKKYDGIKHGVSEVKNGNLSYKIPVVKGPRGGYGELDRLAMDINDISQSSNIAVQNELKNQRLKTELISNVSHDLKTPLTSMITYVDLLKQEGLDSENAPEYLDIIDGKTQRLKALTENLFDAAKASSGTIPVNMESIDLSSLITQSLAEMEARLESHGLQVQVQNNCEESRVMADGQLMWRVMENLLGNISKYALDGSRVYINVNEVAASKDGKDMVMIEVKNISRDQLNISADELMERFKRGDESRNTEGSGLGLAIAKDLVKLMNGEFKITIDGDLFKATVVLEKAEKIN